MTNAIDTTPIAATLATIADPIEAMTLVTEFVARAFGIKRPVMVGENEVHVETPSFEIATAMIAALENEGVTAFVYDERMVISIFV